MPNNFFDNQSVTEAWEEFQRHAEGDTWPEEDATIGSAHRLIRAREVVKIHDALKSALAAMELMADAAPEMRDNPQISAAFGDIDSAQTIIQAVALWDTRWLPEESEGMLEGESNIV